MRAMNIRITTREKGWPAIHAAFRKNWKHYLQEALGLGIFMISACFFGAMLEGEGSTLHSVIPDHKVRLILTGLLMGSTALFIFYSPFTAPSGSHINPAVTLSFLRMGKFCPWDSMFYIILQFLGGTLAVLVMQALLGNSLTDPPVYSAATIPGHWGPGAALVTELVTSFLMMTMVLYTSARENLRKYTRIIAAVMVCCYVILAGPISGFGMNPARSFASALPSGIWTTWWIYMFAPIVGMLAAVECSLRYKQIKEKSRIRSFQRRIGIL